MEKESLKRHAVDQRGRLVHIKDANYFDKYYCQYNKEPLIVKRGNVRKMHFAYKNLNPRVETRLHKSCKQYFVDNYFVLEEYKLENNRIADIYFEVADLKVAVEVQNSKISRDEILERTKDYFELGVNVLWIIPIKSRKYFNKWNPCVTEKTFSNMYNSKCYYWDKQTETIFAARFDQVGEDDYGRKLYKPYISRDALLIDFRPFVWHNKVVYDEEGNWEFQKYNFDDPYYLMECDWVSYHDIYRGDEVQ